jgi:chitinase
MISYDDPESLTAKLDLVHREGLGGVMFWELSGDDAENTLLQTLRDQLPP